jgi:holo-[acyl-carrier protein] synthase
MYCGTDIIEVQRIRDAIDSNYDFKYKIFTKNEIDDIDNINNDTKYQRYAGRFAAKEAIYKAMSKILIENNITVEFDDIEIENVDYLRRRPKVNFLNDELKVIMEIYDIDISISHVKDNAIAMCIVN